MRNRRIANVYIAILNSLLSGLFFEGMDLMSSNQYGLPANCGNICIAPDSATFSYCWENGVS